ncbi:MAG: hypothetical protein I3273_02780 [Candidatus Moeniiplasma glomeromycotorum]|nr:hypothetical protein [Candidatus Moeniiplasma glomeromycotorum]
MVIFCFPIRKLLRILRKSRDLFFDLFLVTWFLQVMWKSRDFSQKGKTWLSVANRFLLTVFGVYCGSRDHLLFHVISSFGYRFLQRWCNFCSKLIIKSMWRLFLTTFPKKNKFFLGKILWFHS